MKNRLKARHSRFALLALAITAAAAIFLASVTHIDAAAASIKVITPNGGEQLRAGQTAPIKWQSSGVTGPVVIVLYKNGIKRQVIARQAPNNGLFRWKIPSNLLKGNDYRIRIRSLKNLAVNDFSDRNFSIK